MFTRSVEYATDIVSRNTTVVGLAIEHAAWTIVACDTVDDRSSEDCIGHRMAWIISWIVVGRIILRRRTLHHVRGAACAEQGQNQKKGNELRGGFHDVLYAATASVLATSDTRISYT